MISAAVWLLRLALASAFGSASLDRLGAWGAPGAPGVAWGAWQPFLDYTAKLLWFLPAAWVPAFGLMATVAEIALAVLLLAGLWLRTTARASAALLTSFALTMTAALGVKAPLDYSVFTSIAAAFALAALASASQSKASVSS